jgi:hypothetical protein
LRIASAAAALSTDSLLLVPTKNLQNHVESMLENTAYEQKVEVQQWESVQQRMLKELGVPGASISIYEVLTWLEEMLNRRKLRWPKLMRFEVCSRLTDARSVDSCAR